MDWNLQSDAGTLIQKPLFLTKFEIYSWNLWIMIHKDTSPAQIYYGENMKCYQINDNLLRVNVTFDGLNSAHFWRKQISKKCRIQFLSMIFRRSVVQHVVIVCAKGQLCSCKCWGDIVIYMCQISFVHVNRATDWYFLKNAKIMAQSIPSMPIPNSPSGICHYVLEKLQMAHGGARHSLQKPNMVALK